MAHVLHSFWRRHRWTALRSLLLVALLHRLHFLAFLAASSPVWLLTAFLLGAVLVNSEPNVPLAAASEDEDRHLYKKIRRHQPVTGATGSGSSQSDDDNESSVTSMEDHLVVDKAEEEEEVLKAAVAWTADDEHSIRSIGSLELERDARLEKLMSSRTTAHRNLIDLDVHIPAVMAPSRTNNPFDLNHHSPPSYYDDGHGASAAAPAGSSPSSLLVQHTNNNPFDIDIDIQQQRERDSCDPDEEGDNDAAIIMLRRHESFTGASAAPLARPSRFKPYFVADVPEGGGGRDAGSDNSNSNASSPSSSTASDRQAQQEAAQATVRVEEAPAAPTPLSKWDGKGNGMVMAVDVELISDSSDDDMSLQGDDVTGGGGGGGSLNNARGHSDDDEEDSFEVESITQQVAAGRYLLFCILDSYCLLQMQIDVMPCAGNQQLQLQPPRVTAVVEPVSPPSEQGHRQQQHEDDDKKDVGIVSGSNESTLASVKENEQRERELTEIREHHILGAVPVIDSSGTSAGARVGATGAAVAPPATAAAAGPPPLAAPPQPAAAASAPTPPAAAAAARPPPVATPPQPAAAAAAAAPTPRATAAAPPSGKLSSKSKVASKKIDPKKAVFGLFRK